MSKRTGSIVGLVALMIVAVVVLITQLPRTQSSTAQDNAASSPTSQGRLTEEQPEQKASQIPGTASDDLTRYSNEEYGISFEYPKKWSLEDNIGDSSSGVIPVESYITLIGDVAGKYPETMQITVINKGLQDVANFNEEAFRQSSIAKVARVDGRLKGKDSVHITSTIPNDYKTELYLFAVGNKTYSLVSVSERVNKQRYPDYWDIFNNTYNSLQLK